MPDRRAVLIYEECGPDVRRMPPRSGRGAPDDAADLGRLLFAVAAEDRVQFGAVGGRGIARQILLEGPALSAGALALGGAAPGAELRQRRGAVHMAVLIFWAASSGLPSTPSLTGNQ